MALPPDSLSDAFDILPEAVLLVRSDGEIISLNEVARDLLPGCEPGESLASRIAGGQAGFDAATGPLRRASGNLPLALTLKTDTGEQRLRVVGRRLRKTIDGVQFMLRVPGEARNSFGALSLKVEALDREVRARRAAQQTAEEALAINKVLTRELYHRVNNNLQMQISLLRRAGREAGDARMSDFVNRSIGRLRAMSVGLDLTYRRGAGALVDISDVLTLLVSQLSENLSVDGQIRLELETPFSVPDVQVTPLALIVNEAVTNAFRRGGSPESQRIVLHCRAEAQSARLDLLQYGDDPFEDLAHQSDAEAALIDILARQAAVSVEPITSPTAGLRLTFRAL